MRVLVALDGSQLSEKALDAVADLHPGEQIDVVLTTVLDPAKVHETWRETFTEMRATPREVPIGEVHEVARHAPGAAVEDRNQALERRRVEATEYLEDVARRLPANVSSKLVVEWSGSAAEAIVDIAKREQAELVVVGTHGRTGLRKLLMGSVAEKVLKSSPVRVVVVRDSGSAPA